MIVAVAYGVVVRVMVGVVIGVMVVVRLMGGLTNEFVDGLVCGWVGL